MYTNKTEHIHEAFVHKWMHKDIENNMISILGASFEVDKNSIFGTPNLEYIDAEIKWYESQSRHVNDLFDLYGKEVKIWKEICSTPGYINSNYGWTIYSWDNGDQYNNVLKKLCQEPRSRQASMIYQRPTMHKDWNHQGMMDFTCTNAVTYYITKGYQLDCVVQMRSNDVVFGYNNDVAWQKHVWVKLRDDLNYIRDKIGMNKITLGKMHWQVQNLHMYNRHFKLIEEYIDKNK